MNKAWVATAGEAGCWFGVLRGADGLSVNPLLTPHESLSSHPEPLKLPTTHVGDEQGIRPQFSRSAQRNPATSNRGGNHHILSPVHRIHITARTLLAILLHRIHATAVDAERLAE